MRRGALVSAANLSEGRDPGVLAALRSAAGDRLADLHADGDHHRSVVTMIGDGPSLLAAVLRLAEVAIERIDLAAHRGVHPRLGAIDVVPFAPLYGDDLSACVAVRDDACRSLGALGLPCFRYGPMPDGSMRTLPEVRRGAFRAFGPDAGPERPHPSAGAVCVGARHALVAWNAWIHGASLAATRAVAAQVRTTGLLALGLEVRGATQVSCNLVAPEAFTPLDAYLRIEAALPEGSRIVRGELVGLIPARVLDKVPEPWWARLGLGADRTFERAAGALGGGARED